MTHPEVLAAGGVVTRTKKGATQVLLVHRPRYDDWSLPKGKVDDGESLATTAVREVMEETGVTATLGPHLGSVDYVDRSDRSKRVHWWAMTAESQVKHLADDEVDQVEWRDIESARRQLTYRTDRQVLSVAGRSRRSLVILRHGRAGDRGSHHPDRKRRLSNLGREQAAGLVSGLADLHISTIVTSPFKRCVQTVKPLAKARGIEIVKDKRLAEDAALEPVLDLIAQLPSGALICSHGDVIGALVGHLAADADTPQDQAFGPLRLEKGSAWWVTLNGSRARAATYFPPTDRDPSR